MPSSIDRSTRSLNTTDRPSLKAVLMRLESSTESAKQTPVRPVNKQTIALTGSRYGSAEREGNFIYRWMMWVDGVAWVLEATSTKSSFRRGGWRTTAAASEIFKTRIVTELLPTHQ